MTMESTMANNSDSNEKGNHWTSIGQGLTLLSWILLIVALFMLDRSHPQQANLMDKRWDSPVRGVWDVDLARMSFQLIMANLGVGVLGFILKGVLNGGDSDIYIKHIGFTFFATLAAFFYCLLQVPV